MLQRRRMSSGGSSVSGPSSASTSSNPNTNRMLLSQRRQTSSPTSTGSAVSPLTPASAQEQLQQPQLSSGSRLLMQQLSSGPIHNSQPRPVHYGGWAQNIGGYRMHQQQGQRHAPPASQQVLGLQFQPPMNQHRGIMMLGQQQRQQDQQQQRHYMNRPQQLQHSVQQQSSQQQHGGAAGDSGRSLLQQLLSE